MSFLRFFDDNDDAIFEPGSLITFPMFTWSNQGGLSCPAGGVRGVRAWSSRISASHLITRMSNVSLIKS